MPVFSGNKGDLEVFLRQISGMFYVYEICRPNGVAFYVGKGVNRRVLEHELEALRNHRLGESNPFKCNVIRKILSEGDELLYRIDSTYDSRSELECLSREAEMISHYGRLHEGGPLTNLAAGMGSTSGNSPHSTKKHAATLSGIPEQNPNRATLNRFLLSIGPVGSVPIKPVEQISRILPTTPHPNKRSPTLRCAYALVASASAHGMQLFDGVCIPRSFSFDGVDGIIENGVARDILKAGMATLVHADNPQNEAFRLDARQCQILAGLFGREHLFKRGLL